MNNERHELYPELVRVTRPTASKMLNKGEKVYFTSPWDTFPWPLTLYIETLELGLSENVRKKFKYYIDGGKQNDN